MTGYIKKFDDNVKIPFKACEKQLFKSIIKYGKKLTMLLKIEFDSKPVYGDDNKYIKTKNKIHAGGMITNFQDKRESIV